MLFRAALALPLSVLLACGSTSRSQPAPTATPEGADKHPGAHGKDHVEHSFTDAEAWAARFERADRDDWQKPALVISFLGLPDQGEGKGEFRIADIGAATGYFPVRIAKSFPHAQVIGADIEATMVEYLNQRALKEALSNLESVLAEPNDPKLGRPVDHVLIVNTYHHIANRVSYLKHLEQYLAEGARVTIVDFDPAKPTDLGPPVHMRFPLEKVAEEFALAGYREVKRDIATLPYQYMIQFVRREGSGGGLGY